MVDTAQQRLATSGGGNVKLSHLVNKEPTNQRLSGSAELHRQKGELEDRERQLVLFQQRLADRAIKAKYFINVDSGNVHNFVSGGTPHSELHDDLRSKTFVPQISIPIAPRRSPDSGKPTYGLRDWNKEYPASVSSTGAGGVVNAYKRHRGPDWQSPEVFMHKREIDALDNQDALQNIPRNIQHKFGTQQCANLFANHPLVIKTPPSTLPRLDRKRQAGKFTAFVADGSGKNSRSEERIASVEESACAVTDSRTQRESSYHRDRQSRGFLTRTRGVRDRFQDDDDLDEMSLYEDMCQVLRQNINHTNGRTYRRSVTHTHFTEAPFQKGIHVTDQYRYRKDDLSRWAEQNIIRNRRVDPVEEKRREEQRWALDAKLYRRD